MSQEHITSFIDNYLQGLQILKISEESIEHIRKKLKIIQIKSKDTLILPGEVCTSIYLIIQGGFVCRYIHEGTGSAKTINFYLENLHPIMACLDSYFSQKPTNCELKAITQSSVIALPKSSVDVLKQSDEYFAKFYHDV